MAKTTPCTVEPARPACGRGRAPQMFDTSDQKQPRRAIVARFADFPFNCGPGARFRGEEKPPLDSPQDCKLVSLLSAGPFLADVAAFQGAARCSPAENIFKGKLARRVGRFARSPALRAQDFGGGAPTAGQGQARPSTHPTHDPFTHRAPRAGGATPESRDHRRRLRRPDGGLRARRAIAR